MLVKSSSNCIFGIFSNKKCDYLDCRVLRIKKSFINVNSFYNDIFVAYYKRDMRLSYYWEYENDYKNLFENVIIITSLYYTEGSHSVAWNYMYNKQLFAVLISVKEWLLR